MGSKKIIVIAIVLFLVGGMGTFVFANKPNDITPEDINYSKENATNEIIPHVINNNVNNEVNSDDDKLNDGLEEEKVDTPTSMPTEEKNNSDTTVSTTEPINKPQQNPVVPEQSKPVVPEQNKPVAPEQNTPVVPEQNKPVAPEQNTPVVPEQNKPVAPEQSKPDVPEQNKPVAPEQNKPDVPEQNIPVAPEQPVISDITAPVLGISYSTLSSTKDSVKVTITANEEIKEVVGWNLSNDGLSLTKYSSNNDNGEVVVYDLAGNASKIAYSISNIDNIKPSAVVTTSNNNGLKQTFRDIQVTITADEDIKEVAGWNLENKRILTKTFGREIFSTDASGKIIVEDIANKLVITDLVGNETEVYYEIKNYNPDIPEVIITKKEVRRGNVITVTQIYNKPIDGTWQENENGDFIKINNLANDSDSVSIVLPDGTIQMIKNNGIITTTPDGKIEFEEAFNIDVDISNYNATTKVSTSTNKPVTVVIKANREIDNLKSWQEKGWNVKDNKTLEKEFSKVTRITEDIYDLFGNKISINRNVSNIDMIPAKINIADVVNGNVELVTDDFISLPNGWKSNYSTNIKIVFKPISEFIQNGDKKEADIELKDRFGNIANYKVIINSDNTVTYEKID